MNDMYSSKERKQGMGRNEISEMNTFSLGEGLLKKNMF